MFATIPRLNVRRGLSLRTPSLFAPPMALPSQPYACAAAVRAPGCATCSPKIGCIRATSSCPCSSAKAGLRGADRDRCRASAAGRVDRIAERGEGGALTSAFPASRSSRTRPTNLRTEDAREALNPDNLICRAIKAIKDAVPEIGVLTDVALDPYTAHGHDGLIDDQRLRDQRRHGRGAGRAGAGPGRRRARTSSRRPT